MNCDNFWPTWKTWTESSRVGTSTKTRVMGFRFFGRNKSLSNIGSIKAAVFPVPVAEHAQISRPANTTGIQTCWIGVGWRKPTENTA